MDLNCRHSQNLLQSQPFLVFIIFLCAAFVGVGQVFAQSIPPDILERQLQRERQYQEYLEQKRRQQEPDVRVDPKQFTLPSLVIPKDESPCFVIEQVNLIGDRADEFTWAVNKVLFPEAEAAEDADTQDSPLLGHCYGIKGINVLMRRIQNEVIKKGWITTRIVAGPQDLNTGVLTLTLVPGYISRIRFSDSGKPSQTALSVSEGELLNLRDIEQTLENLKTLSSVATDIQIVPSQGEEAKPGSSDLLIVWSQHGKPWRILLSADDSGSESTGVYIGNLSLAYENVFGLNDILTLAVGQEFGGADDDDAGFDSYSLGYRLPIKNWQLALSASHYSYTQIVGGAVQTFEYSGESETYSIDLSRLAYRDNQRKVSTGLKLWTRRSRNYIEDVEVENQQRRVAGIDAGLFYRHYFGPKVLNSSFIYSRGLDVLGAESAPEENADGGGTARPTILKTHLQLTMPFKVGYQGFNYQLQWRHQHNRDRLTTPDYFNIGNRYTVRGYDGEQSVSGERGWVLRNDINIIREDGPAYMYVGFDYGRISGVSNREDGVDWLAGAAVGLRSRWKHFSYDFSVSRAIRVPKTIENDLWLAEFSLNWQF